MELKTDKQELDEKRQAEFFKLFHEIDLTKDEVESIYTKVLLGDNIDKKYSDLALKIKEEIIDNGICVNNILGIFDKYYGKKELINFDDILKEIFGDKYIIFK